MSAGLFWGAVGLIVYTYVLFPVLLLVRALVRPRSFAAADITPTVSVVIAAHDEAETIGAKLDNLLALDYPPAQLEIVIASDGSDDGTDEIVRARIEREAGASVRLLSLPRRGKAAALNDAVAGAGGDILVFSDANSIYARDALRALVRPFADPAVGGVAGNQVYADDRGPSGAAAGERGYWSLDRQLKLAESRAGNVISATGAIYAIRRALFRPVPPDVTDDFVTSTRVIAQGYRLVFAPEALAYEPTAPSSGAEFGRKVRVITRGLRGVLAVRELLDPFRHGFYALQLFTHKVLRRLMVFPLLLALAASALLWSEGLLYEVALIAQAAVYGLGLLGALLVRTPLGRLPLLSVPAFFCLVNAAAFRAVVNLATGRRIDRWEPVRAEPRGLPSALAPGTTSGQSVGVADEEES